MGYKIYMSEKAIMKHSIGDDTLKFSILIFLFTLAFVVIIVLETSFYVEDALYTKDISCKINGD